MATCRLEPPLAAAGVAIIASTLSSGWMPRVAIGQRGALVAIDLAELGQLGDQGASDDVANAGHAVEQILFGAPDRAGFDQFLDRLVDARPLGFEQLEHRPKRALRNAIAGSGQTLFFGIDHDNELAPPLHQFGKPQRKVIGQWPRRWAHRRKMGDHWGVKRIGLSQEANGAGELLHLVQVDDHHRQRCLCLYRRDDIVMDIAGVERDQRGRQRLQPRYQCTRTLQISGATKRHPIRGTCTSTRAFDTLCSTKRSTVISTSITQPSRCRLVPKRLVGGMPADAGRSLTISKTTMHSGYQLDSFSQGTSTSLMKQG